MIDIKTKEQFEDIKNSSEKFIVKFSAPWCTPCRVLGETMKKLEPKYEDIKFCEVDVDEVDEEFVDEFNVRNIPVTFFYKNGEMVNKRIGLIQENELEEFLNQI